MEENLEWARAGSGTLDARAGGGGGALRRDPDHQPWRHTAGLGRLRLRGTADPGGGATSGSWLVLDSGVGCGLWDRRGGSGSRISFNPSLFNAGDLGGRALGINWVWAQWTLGYHAVWSISIPILLARASVSRPPFGALARTGGTDHYRRLLRARRPGFHTHERDA